MKKHVCRGYAIQALLIILQEQLYHKDNIKKWQLLCFSLFHHKTPINSVTSN